MDSLIKGMKRTRIEYDDDIDDITTKMSKANVMSAGEEYYLLQKRYNFFIKNEGNTIPLKWIVQADIQYKRILANVEDWQNSIYIRRQIDNFLSTDLSDSNIPSLIFEIDWMLLDYIEDLNGLK